MNRLKKICSQVRRDIIRMTHSAKSGHPGGSLGCVEYMVALYFSVMKHNPNFSMDGIGEDIFFLSNGHISPVWYSVLARSGYFELKELSTFRKINSRVQGHPTTHEGLPGIRIASGSLGQGLSVAIGAALSKKLNQDSHLVFSLHGDGEIQEGQIWEAAMFAAHHKVDNLISTIDFNRQQIDGPTDKVITPGNMRAKWESFGWLVLETEGNDMEQVLKTLENAKKETRKHIPVMILLHSVMGKGVDFMENNYKWHGVPPDDEQCVMALAQLEETLGDY